MSIDSSLKTISYTESHIFQSQQLSFAGNRKTLKSRNWLQIRIPASLMEKVFRIATGNEQKIVATQDLILSPPNPRQFR
jgi:hypothetical protein